MNLKRRIGKVEAQQPPPESEIEYTTCWGNEEPEEPGELVSVKGTNPAIETYKLPDGSLKEVWHYKTEWPEPPEGVSLKNERS